MRKSLFIIQMFFIPAIFGILGFRHLSYSTFLFDLLATILLLTIWLIPSLTLYGARGTIDSFKTAFNKDATKVMKLKAISYFKAMGSFTIMSGIAISIYFVIMMMANLEDSASVGPNMAMALIQPLYCIILSVSVFMPLRFSLEKDLNSDS